MSSIDFESLLVIVFVLVDDWYQLEKKPTKVKSPGVQPEMSNSEIMTLALMMDYLHLVIDIIKELNDIRIQYPAITALT